VSECVSACVRLVVREEAASVAVGGVMIGIGPTSWAEQRVGSLARWARHHQHSVSRTCIEDDCVSACVVHALKHRQICIAGAKGEMCTQSHCNILLVARRNRAPTCCTWLPSSILSSNTSLQRLPVFLQCWSLGLVQVQVTPPPHCMGIG
jgi:hypothetical protein